MVHRSYPCCRTIAASHRCLPPSSVTFSTSHRCHLFLAAHAPLPFPRLWWDTHPLAEHTAEEHTHAYTLHCYWAYTCSCRTTHLGLHTPPGCPLPLLPQLRAPPAHISMDTHHSWPSLQHTLLHTLAHTTMPGSCYPRHHHGNCASTRTPTAFPGWRTPHTHTGCTPAHHTLTPHPCHHLHIHFPHHAHTLPPGTILVASLSRKEGAQEGGGCTRAASATTTGACTGRQRAIPQPACAWPASFPSGRVLMACVVFSQTDLFSDCTGVLLRYHFIHT